MNKRDLLISIFNEAIHGVEPSRLVRGHIHEISDRSFKRLLVIGFGKASLQMAKAVEDVVEEDMVTGGIVITKYGHILTSRHPGPPNLKLFEAGHPVPDENGVRATEEILRLLRRADEETLILCLISGGGSALLVSPYNGITLSEKQEVTELLLNAGADITELNAVRKHLSRVKGGRLAEIAYPAVVISLILSDVIGDRLDVIASGPTAPDPTTYADTIDVLDKYHLTDIVPQNVMDILRKGRAGHIPETPDKNSPVFVNVKNIIIGNNLLALESARRCAIGMGYRAEIISSELSGEARDAGMWLASEARKFRSAEARKHKKPLCLISGGETTVTVKGDGLGGRNMELALSFAIEIEGVDGITLLSAGTDGTDGPTDAAGAIVNGRTVLNAKEIGLNPQDYLNNNDSYNFFKKTGELFITGPTGTNVMDMQLILVE